MFKHLLSFFFFHYLLLRLIGVSFSILIKSAGKGARFARELGDGRVCLCGGGVQ